MRLAGADTLLAEDWLEMLLMLAVRLEEARGIMSWFENREKGAEVEEVEATGVTEEEDDEPLSDAESEEDEEVEEAALLVRRRAISAL